MKIRIENFQSIRFLDFEVEGFTVIVGPSSIGKSSIFRAIQYALHSKSGSEGFVRVGAEFSRVTIWDEGFEAVWEKGPKVNRYFFNGDPVPVEKVGRGEVPQQIIDAGFSDVVLREGKLKLSPQFARQRDGNVFLLDDPPAVVAEVLAQLSRLEVLMRAEKTTALDVTRIKRRLKVREEDESRLEGRLDSFRGLEEVQESLVGLRVLGDELVSSESFYEGVKSMGGRLEQIRGRLRALAPLSSSVPPALMEEDLLRKWSQAGEYLSQLQDARRRLSIFLPLSCSYPPELPGKSPIERWGRVKEVHSQLDRVRKRLGCLSLLGSVEVPSPPSTERWLQVKGIACRFSKVAYLAGVELPLVPGLVDPSQYLSVSKRAVEIGTLQERQRQIARDQQVLRDELARSQDTLRDLEDQMGQCPTCGKGFHE